MAKYIDVDSFIEKLREHQKLHSPSMSKLANEAIDLGLSLAMRIARTEPAIDVDKVTRCDKCEYQETCEQYLYIDSCRQELVFCSYGVPKPQ